MAPGTFWRTVGGARSMGCAVKAVKWIADSVTNLQRLDDAGMSGALWGFTPGRAQHLEALGTVLAVFGSGSVALVRGLELLAYEGPEDVDEVIAGHASAGCDFQVGLTAPLEPRLLLEPVLRRLCDLAVG